jgi:hypothetical protein
MIKKSLSLKIVLTGITLALITSNSIADRVYYGVDDPYNGYRDYNRRSRSVSNRGTSDLNYDKVQEKNIKNQGEALSRKIIADEYKDVLPAGYSSIGLSNLTPEAKEILDKKKAEQDAAKKAATSAGKKYIDPINPKAKEVLQKMSDYIGGLKTLRMSLDEIKEAPTASGQVVQERIHQSYIMKRPNKLSIKSTGTKVDKKLIFDGQNLAINDYKSGKEINVSIPGTVDHLISEIYKKQDYVVPVADLLYSDIFSSINSNITKAEYKGSVVMDNKNCHYLICMSGNTRWQIWITSQGHPTPVRMIIEYPGKSKVKRYAAKITDLRSAGDIPDDEFSISPTANVAKK